MRLMDLADIVEMNAIGVVRYNDRINRLPKTAIVELLHADGSKADTYAANVVPSFLVLLRMAEKTLPRKTNQDQRWVIRFESGGHEVESGTIVWPPGWPE